MMDEQWKTALWQQFGAAIDMLHNAIEACPDALWGRPLPEAPILVRLVPYAFLSGFLPVGIGERHSFPLRRSLSMSWMNGG